MSPPALAGRRVVVTRPAGQTAHLAALIRAAGGEPVLFPALEILDAENLQPLAALVERLEAFDLAIFVSANAVDKALALVQARRAWPAGLRVATVGRGSERALERHGFAAVIAPGERFDSEALLALPELKDVAGKRVVIFRGDGGRELLGDTLAARGATVDYITCYRRGKPEIDATPLLKLWNDGQCDAVTATSSEGLRNLYDMVGKLGQSWLRKTPTFVPHARIAEQARALGLTRPILTGPGDAGLIDGLVDHFKSAQHVD